MYCIKAKKISRKGFRGMVKDDFLADLNKDRKKELYFVIEYKNSSLLRGFIFDEGKSIEIKKQTPKDLGKVNISSYRLERNQWVERYKFLSKEGKIEAKESRYNLVIRDGGYELLPQGWSKSELEGMTGQYASRGSLESGHYKTLIIGQREGGKWKVNIKVRQTSDKKVLCEFNGLGAFVDKDLFVPLNQSDPSLKGRLQIRFLDLLATVYTEEVADNKEMNSFCTGRGSIAGNYKKTDI